jgi:hypothetical protein
MTLEIRNYDVEKLKDLVTELENDSEPLTKPKAKKQPKVSEPVETITVPVKQKKGWTPTKQEAFKKVQEARRKQVEGIYKKKKLESARVLLSELEIRKKEEETKPKPVQTKQELQQEPDDNDDTSSNSSKEEIIVKKKSSKKAVDKKKKKKTIIIQSESDDDSDEEEEELPKAKKQREFKSARNKKSIIKVHGEAFNPDKYFV